MRRCPSAISVCMKLPCWPRAFSHTTPEGKRFAHRIMDDLNEHIKKVAWRNEYRFALYGTPAESLTHRFCQKDRSRFGNIKDVTDKGYYTNSYHVDVREPINVFDKFCLLNLSLKTSPQAVASVMPKYLTWLIMFRLFLTMIEYIYDHISYGEFNTKLDYCHECGLTVNRVE